MREIVDIVASVQCWSNVGMSTPTFPPTANLGQGHPCYLGADAQQSLIHLKARHACQLLDNVDMQNMQNLIIIYHVVQEIFAFSLTGSG